MGLHQAAANQFDSKGPMQPITKEGYEKLKDEIKQLKYEKRPAIAQAIGTAREMGDLSENAEYQAAKEQQRINEGKLRQLETLLINAEVIHPALANREKVAFGATVQVLDLKATEKSVYKIVGTYEVDIAQGKISFMSPLAKALMGKKVGATAVVELPDSTTKEYRILSISYE